MAINDPQDGRPNFRFTAESWRIWGLCGVYYAAKAANQQGIWGANRVQCLLDCGSSDPTKTKLVVKCCATDTAHGIPDSDKIFATAAVIAPVSGQSTVAQVVEIPDGNVDLCFSIEPSMTKTVTCTLSGAINAGDKITITLNAVDFGPYTVLIGDTLATIATALATLIQADPNYSSTTSNGPVITIKGATNLDFTYSATIVTAAVPPLAAAFANVTLPIKVDTTFYRQW